MRELLTPLLCWKDIMNVTVPIISTNHFICIGMRKPNRIGRFGNIIAQAIRMPKMAPERLWWVHGFPQGSR